MCFEIISCFTILVIYGSEVFTHCVSHLLLSPSISALLFNIRTNVLISPHSDLECESGSMAM